ncbi:metallophosphoesterase family protein [Anaeromyxobacter paludicola]|uniref:Phosphoesterase n=1 Tax=Anaeromyxobacter paludicola TaxID=2918171 RepID=A0ABN6N738_9BACT|nr:metallophosphoesterase family protein [Anaeromyxobacter paludicola]BDG07844.1 phosphoesterase [Anaeromyxobacter paludicola]
MRLGLVSDTHDLVDGHLHRLFAGCERILHGGDVADEDVLQELSLLAPVVAVRGNNDAGRWADALPELRVVEVGALRALLVHQLPSPDRPDPAVVRAIAREHADLVLFGHSHRPLVTRAGGVLFVNPGSAGPRRFSLPRTAGLLDVEGRRARISLFELSGEAPVPFGRPLEAEL